MKKVIKRITVKCKGCGKKFVVDVYPDVKNYEICPFCQKKMHVGKAANLNR